MKDDANKLPRSAEKLIGDFLGVPNEPARGKIRATKPVAEWMEKLLAKHHIGREAPEHTIREKWFDIVGGANAAYSHPLDIDPRGRLTVLASHAVVRNELFQHRAIIAEKIRKLPGCGHVREMYVRAG